MNPFLLCYRPRSWRSRQSILKLVVVYFYSLDFVLDLGVCSKHYLDVEIPETASSPIAT